MKQVIIFLLLSLSLSVDCSLLTRILTFGIRPSLTLCVIMCLGIQNGRFTGSMAGLCSGLIMDYMFGPRMGYYSLLMMITGYAACTFYVSRFSENVLMLAVYMAAVYCGKELLFALAARLIGANPENILLLFVRYILPSGVLTGLCIIPINAFVRWLFKFNVMKKRWKISTE